MSNKNRALVGKLFEGFKSLEMCQMCLSAQEGRIELADGISIPVEHVVEVLRRRTEDNYNLSINNCLELISRDSDSEVTQEEVKGAISSLKGDIDVYCELLSALQGSNDALSGLTEKNEEIQELKGQIEAAQSQLVAYLDTLGEIEASMKQAVAQKSALSLKAEAMAQQLANREVIVASVLSVAQAREEALEANLTPVAPSFGYTMAKGLVVNASKLATAVLLLAASQDSQAGSNPSEPMLYGLARKLIMHATELLSSYLEDYVYAYDSNESAIFNDFAPVVLALVFNYAAYKLLGLVFSLASYLASSCCCKPKAQEMPEMPNTEGVSLAQCKLNILEAELGKARELNQEGRFNSELKVAENLFANIQDKGTTADDFERSASKLMSILSEISSSDAKDDAGEGTSGVSHEEVAGAGVA